MQRRLSILDISIWVLVVYLVMHLPSIETRVDEMEQAAQKYREQNPSSTEEPPPTTQAPSTPPPRRTLEPNKCFHQPRTECPTGALKCRQIDIESVFCCDVNNFTLKEGLAATMSQQNMSHVKYLHVLNASLNELNISLSHYRRLSSMAFTDGNIGNITGQFPKHAVLSCLNISNNNLSMDLPSVQRPFSYLFNLSVVDASHNNLTEFPLITHSNRKVSVDLSGNKYMPCRHFQRAMESNNTVFMNVNNTYCALDLKVGRAFISDLTFVPINYITWQKMINESCRNIKPNVNCSCAPERFDLVGDDVKRVVAVDCTNRHLKEMPVNLPPNTVKLNVSFNNITSLKAVEDDPTYDHVRQLIVDYNEISSLTDLEGTKFLDNFILFSVTHNKLKTIPIHVFTRQFMSPAPTVLIGRNYIHCDCNTEKNIKPFLVENHKNIPDYKHLQCDNDMGAVVDLLEFQVCHTSRDWTDFIYYIITMEVLVLMLLISKVSYDYWVFKTTGYLPWPANKMPRLPCDWFCE